MGKREKLADEAQADLDRVFPGSKRGPLPVRGYTTDGRGPLIPPGDPKTKDPNRGR
jgi:hypothetical protein